MVRILVWLWGGLEAFGGFAGVFFFVFFFFLVFCVFWHMEVSRLEVKGSCSRWPTPQSQQGGI